MPGNLADPASAKYCAGCKRILPLALFRRQTRTPDGRDSRCGECTRRQVAANRRDTRAKVLAHYGTSCACCGSVQDLTIDHMNGDGYEHRKNVLVRGGYATYRWLINNNYPDGFQTLCRPCNDSKGRGAACLLHNPDPRLAIIRQMAESGASQLDIGKAVGLTQTAVSAIMRYRLDITRGRGRFGAPKDERGKYACDNQM